MKEETFNEIMDSHSNGNMAQMIRQINAYDPYDFAVDLELNETVTDGDKFDILRKYIMYNKG